jgi:purine nucleosidase
MAESLTRIILDTDLAMGAPGSPVDDGFALALAVADPGIRLELVTTVGGNSNVQMVTELTTNLLGVLRQTEMPVVQGAAEPVNPAAAEIVARVMSEPGELTIMAIGPLTNIASALQLDPSVATAVREIVVMGGVFLDQTRSAEYNFKCDPDAAQIVLDSGAALRLVGLDVTEKVRFTRADTKQLARGGGFGQYAANHAEARISKHQTISHAESEQDSFALHDPLAVAVVTRPDLVTWLDAYVTVETGPVTPGSVIVDLLTKENPPGANCRIATEVDVDGFRELFFERMAALR